MTKLKSLYLNYIKNPRVSKLIINNTVKRNKITKDDIKKAENIAFDFCNVNDDKEYFLKFMPFDFDCKKLGDLTESEAKEKAFKLWECLGKPTPAVIQRSKSGKGVHLLVSATCSQPIYWRDHKNNSWKKNTKFYEMIDQLETVFHIDKSTFKPTGCIDLVAVGEKGVSFKPLMKAEGEKPLKVNEELYGAVLQYCKRNKTPTELTSYIYRLIENLRNTTENRNIALSLTAGTIFSYSWYTGFNEEAVKDLIKKACEDNNYIQDNSIGEFNRTLESAIKYGKNNKKELNSSISPEINFSTGTDIIYNVENDRANELMYQLLKKLPDTIYYLIDSELYKDIDTLETFKNLDHIIGKLGYRIYSEGTDKKGNLKHKRITKMDNTLSLAFTKINPFKTWDRSIYSIIETPCLWEDGTIVDHRVKHKDNYLFKVPYVNTEDFDIFDDFLDNYDFISDRSKMMAFVAMLTAFGGYYWKYSKPASYYHAISQLGINSGKTSLAKITCNMKSSEIAYVKFSDTKNQNEAENIEKEIVAQLMRGARSLLLDNLPPMQTVFRMSKLDFWLTTDPFNGRILGKSKMYETENNMFYALTGNQVRLSEDLLNRSNLIIFKGKYKGKTEKILHKELGLKLATAIKKYFQVWIEAGKPTGKIEDLPDDITSKDKYPDFWQDVQGILEVNDLDIGDISEYELYEIQNSNNSYEDLLEFLSGKEDNTVENHYKNYTTEINEFIPYGKDKITKLHKILTDHSFRNDRVKIVEHDVDGKPVFRVKRKGI